ncbi:MAG TPA: oligosaccharide flippase family protein [Pyrinomonadaceae bacterium]
MTTEAAKKETSLTVRAAWVMLAKTFAFALAFALPLLLVRRLDQTEYGFYKQVFLLVDSAVFVLPLGFGLSAFYFLPREPERAGQVVFNILLFHFFVGAAACLLLTLQPGLMAAILNNGELTRLAPLVGVAILLWVVSYFIETIAVAHQDLKWAVAFIVGARLTKSGLFIAVALLYPTVEALIYAAIVQGTLQTLVMLVYLRSRFGAFWRGYEWSMMRRQLSYALPLGLSAVLFTMYAYLDNYFVSHRFGAAMYAIYAVGCFNIPLVPMLSDAVGQVMQPRVSYLQKYGTRREIVELTARMMRKLAFVYLPLFVFLLLFAREFIVVLFTEQYIESWPIFAINLVLIPLGIMASATDPVIRAFAEYRHYILKLRICMLLVFIVAVWSGVRAYGLVGAITAAVAVNVVERFITAHKMARVLGVERRDAVLLTDIGKIALASVAAGAAAHFARVLMSDARPFVSLALCGVVFALVYLSAIVVTGMLTLDERQAIRERFEQLQRRTLWKRAADTLS